MELLYGLCFMYRWEYVLWHNLNHYPIIVGSVPMGFTGACQL